MKILVFALLVGCGSAPPCQDTFKNVWRMNPYETSHVETERTALPNGCNLVTDTYYSNGVGSGGHETGVPGSAGRSFLVECEAASCDESDWISKVSDPDQSWLKWGFGRKGNVMVWLTMENK